MYLGEQYVNNPTLSDVTFMVEGRKFHAHRIALLASSDTFRAMFDGHYKEKEASTIPIPNIRFTVFESMMRCIYTGRPLLYLSSGRLISCRCCCMHSSWWRDNVAGCGYTLTWLFLCV